MQEKISVIIPVYRAEKYLTKCIDSVLNQTYTNIEVILVDDGSPDNCGKICDQYTDVDDRIKVIHKDNGGANAARKCGMNIAAGELIGFVDSDDWIEPDMYATLIEPFEHYHIDASLCEYFVNMANGIVKKSESEYSEGYYDLKLLKQDLYPTMICNGRYLDKLISSSMCNKLYRKSVISKYIQKSNDAIIVGEDSAILYPTLLSANGIYATKKYLYHYRQVETSVMHTYKEQLFQQNKIWLNHMIMTCAQANDFDVSEQVINYFIGLSISAVTNEYVLDSPLSNAKKKNAVSLVANDREFVYGISKLDTSGYPIKTKLVAWLLKHKLVYILHCILLLKLSLRRIMKKQLCGRMCK